MTYRDVPQSTFVNDGAFFEKHPDVYPLVRRFEETDASGHIIESWERRGDGRMYDVTERDQLREEIAAAQEQIERLEAKNDD